MHQPSDSVVFVPGARGSGKSSFMMQYARGFGRVIVWSPLEETDQYGPAFGVVPVRTLPEFNAALTLGGNVVYAPAHPSPAKFNFFCKLIWLKVRNALLLVDELKDAAPVNKPAPWWSKVVTQGRHRGIEIIAAAQRPVGINQEIIANSSRTVVFRLKRFIDRKHMAQEIDVDVSLLKLKKLHYLDSDDVNGTVTPGRIVFA